MMEGHLTGSYRVRALRSAFADCDSLFNRTREKIEVRKQALKLRYWPENHPTDDAGSVLDLNLVVDPFAAGAEDRGTAG